MCAKHNMMGAVIAFFVLISNVIISVVVMVSDEFPAVSITAASIWKHQGCAWWVIDWIQTYYLARILAARPSLLCLVRSS